MTTTSPSQRPSAAHPSLTPAQVAALRDPYAARAATVGALVAMGLMHVETTTHTYRARQGRAFGGQMITRLGHDTIRTVTPAGRATLAATVSK